MYRIGVKRQFSAAHRLDEHPGRCARLHGHTWSVEAVLSAVNPGPDGIVVDFEDVGRALEETIAPFDHVCLNDVKPFDETAPTAENVARVLFEGLSERARSASWAAELESMTVWESGEARATFSV